MTKISQRIGCLKRIWRQLTKQARRLFFTAVIQPCFDYGSVVSAMQLSSKDRARMLSLFRRGVRAVVHADSLCPVDPLLKELHLKPLQERWLLNILIFAFKCLSPAAPAAACLQSLFEQTGSTQCITRGQASGTVLVPRRGTTRGCNALDFRLSLLWNKLPMESRCSINLRQFRRLLFELFSNPVANNQFLSLAFSPSHNL